MQRKRVAIVGATGYAGAELTAILARHDGAELAGVYSSGRSELTSLASVHPSLRGVDGPSLESFSIPRVLDAAPDVVFLATPNELSAEVAGSFVDAGVKVIDLSGAFRLQRKGEYPVWYDFEHPRPDLLSEAVYGLTEYCSDSALEKARIVANPGCYPTSVLLALKPLKPMLDRSGAIICDCKSGVSGAGKKADLAYSFAELSGNCKAYGVGHHRHTPEMKQSLDLATYTPFIFTPHLLPTVRGIISTMYVSFLTPHTDAQLASAYEQAYSDKPFVEVRRAGELPELHDVVNTPRCEIGFSLIDGGKRAVVVSVIDNLLKGAASQAVQNMNKMFGFEEELGLVATTTVVPKGLLRRTA
jgi:N-acetyl-gamma-glutamyl-phosphate reductase